MIQSYFRLSGVAIDTTCNGYMRVDLRSIAKAAGLSVATVSRALRGFGNVEPTTRRHVEQIARDLGYVRDPLLCRAQAFVRQPHKPVYRETFAFLAATPLAPKDSRLWLVGIYEGVRQRAAELGYQVESFRLPMSQEGQRALIKQLKFRGIRAVLFSPLVMRQAALFELESAWSAFAAVEIEDKIKSSTLSRVTRLPVQDMAMLLEQLRSRGYRRIGLALSKIDEASRHWQVFSACLLLERQHPEIKIFSLFEDGDDYTPTGLYHWVKRHRLDVIIGNGNYPLDWLKEYEMNAPRDIGVCRIDCLPERPEAGLLIHYEDLGHLAVDLLSSQLEHIHTEGPDIHRIVSIPCLWNEGETLRAVRPVSAGPKSRR
ncbi:MAG: hypothetical protein B9S32_07200 [Verrucomicrobia bacterium Tous-C9LFEB]|nr:MAG: hypothetical protein B9S32_07200 [Verrucomicrobia bacterium Tous-C9LFEB]